MSCLGVHFALTESEAGHLRSPSTDEARLEHVQAVIEETYFGEPPDLKTECDKAWDAMHRALADGQLTWDDGNYPLSHVVLGGERLNSQDDYIISLKTPQQVRDIATVLPDMTEREFRRRYFAIDAKNYGAPLSEEDIGSTWDRFQDVRDLFNRAAKEGRYVLFTAEQ